MRLAAAGPQSVLHTGPMGRLRPFRRAAKDHATRGVTFAPAGGASRHARYVDEPFGSFDRVEPQAVPVSGPRAAEVAKQRISDLLAQGAFRPGARLTGERMLARELGVSRTTLRSALADLEMEGKLISSPQRGWYVPRRTISEPPSALQSFSEMARERGLRPSSTVLKKQTRSATLDEAGKLAIAPASLVLEIELLRALNDSPICIDRTVFGDGPARAFEGVDPTNQSLFELLEKRDGIRVSRCSFSVQAMAATSFSAELLKLHVGEPVLVGISVGYDGLDLPIYLGHTTYRGDAYRFEATLLRPRQ